MSFSTDWLALREEADDAARDVGLLAALAAGLRRRERPLIVEIGCGSGGLTRALRRWAPNAARWRLVDNDPELLARASEAAPGAEIRTLDLLEGVEDAVVGADAVVASAFFDLASAAWIDRLVDALPDDAYFYAALTYDGRETWRPFHADDKAVLDALNAHMRRDKGLGIALGGAASEHLANRLAARKRRVLTAPSPWRLEVPRDGALIAALADGIADAVSAVGVNAAAWRAAGRETVEIGHTDLFAGPLLA